MKYFKIYHYSPRNFNTYLDNNCRFFTREKKLDSVDPAYYGTGVTRGSECKYGKSGLNKSYFYTEDQPQSCVNFGNAIRYEIYLPCDWKENIYDIGRDGSLYLEAKKRLVESQRDSQICISEKEILELMEKIIKEKGYKGFINSLSSLPHVIVLFEKLSTKKPVGEYIVCDWSNNIIETTFTAHQKEHISNTTNTSV